MNKNNDAAQQQAKSNKRLGFIIIFGVFVLGLACGAAPIIWTALLPAICGR